MTALTNLRPIKSIPFGGPVQGGHGIGFTIEFEGGETENFYCRYDQMQMIVSNLISFTSLAEQLLAGTPKESVQVATPYRLTKIGRTGHTDDGKAIAIEVVTDLGFPFQLAMTPEQALETIERLQNELTLAAMPPPPDHRN